MKIHILTENMTRIDAYYLGEPGVSYYIQEDNKNILFDTGYSDIYVSNARKMGIDLTKTDAVVFSHGHNDHTGGLVHFPKTEKKIPIYAHPEVFNRRIYEDLEVGSPLGLDEIKNNFELILSKDPVFLTPKLVYLGQIPRENDFESKSPIGERLTHEKWEKDFLPDDTALCYIGKDGLTIITGCSHSGICNITEYAKKVCKEDKIAGFIGGFHLMDMSPRVDKTVDYIRKQHPKLLCPSHCTCFKARAAINNAIPITEVSVGDVFDIE